MDQGGIGRQVQGVLFRVCKFMDQSGTDGQVQGSLFRVCKFMDQSGTCWQVKGPLVYFTHFFKLQTGWNFKNKWLRPSPFFMSKCLLVGWEIYAAKRSQRLTCPKPKQNPTSQTHPGRRRLRLRYPHHCAPHPRGSSRRWRPGDPNGGRLVVGAQGVGEVGREACRPLWYSLVPLVFLLLQAPCIARFLNDWCALAGKPIQAALLLNYDPSGPSRLLPVVWVFSPSSDHFCFTFFMV